jgi:serine/threonine-protein kinase
MERYEDAVETCRRAGGVLQTLGPGHFVVVANLWKLGTALTGLSQFDAADATLRLAHERAQIGLPENHESRADISNARGWLMLARNRPREAEPLFRAGLKIAAANLPGGGPVVASKQAGLGVALTRLKRYQEAETLLLESYATLLKSLGEVHKEVRKGREYLGDLYTAWGRPDKAAFYRSQPDRTTSN